MAVLVFLALFFSLTGYSSAAYCLCKAGGNDIAYQSTIDWACANGANCVPIQENGPCYQPNNVKAHCDYAANSYYQNKGQTPDSCNFSGTASPSPTLPTTVIAGCTYPAGSGSTTPTTGVPSTPPSMGNTPPSMGSTPPSMGTTPPSAGTTPSTGTGGGIGMYTPPGIAPFGMDPNHASPSLLRNFLPLSLALLPWLLV